MHIRKGENKMNDKKSSEKRQALEAAMASIDKQFGKGAIMKMGEKTQMNIEVIPRWHQW